MEKQKIILGIGFWLGVIVISLINLGMIYLNHNQLAYDWYILGIASIILIMWLIILKKNNKRKT